MKDVVNAIKALSLHDWMDYLGVFAPLLLSVVTIIITLIVACRQVKLENKIAKQQFEMQKRQIKVDTYPYRLECWKALIEIKSFIESVIDMTNNINLKEKTPTQILGIYGILKESMTYGDKEIQTLLIQAQNVFPVSTWYDVKSIRKLYDKILYSFSFFKIYEMDILTEIEKEAKKSKMIDNIIADSKKIDNILMNTILAVDVDLEIADLHTI